MTTLIAGLGHSAFALVAGGEFAHLVYFDVNMRIVAHRHDEGNVKSFMKKDEKK